MLALTGCAPSPLPTYEAVRSEAQAAMQRVVEERGFTEMDSGIEGSSRFVTAAGLLSPPLGFALDAGSQLEHHNQIVSGDINKNGTVLRTIREILSGEATRVG